MRKVDWMQRDFKNSRNCIERITKMTRSDVVKVRKEVFRVLTRQNEVIDEVSVKRKGKK